MATIERKAWKPLYRLIRDGQITETEAYNLVLAVFWQPPQMYYEDEPQTVQPQPLQDVPQPVEVQGFLGKVKANKNE